MAVAPFAIPDRFNAVTFFVDRHVAEGRGGRAAFHHDGGRLTYAELQALVNRTGNALRELGVEREQRVLCLLLDSAEFLAAFWGAIKIGAVPVPLNTMLRGPDYLYFLNDSRARILVVSRLVQPELLVEVEAMAVKPAKATAPSARPRAAAKARAPATSRSSARSRRSGKRR